MNIYLTAIIKAKPAYVTEVTAVLKSLVPQARSEKACLQYDLHQSISDENTFVFYEIWESRSGLDAHNQQPYMASLGKLITDEWIEAPEVYLMNKI